MRLAVLGMGLMGAPLAVRLLKAGCPVSVWNRTVVRAEALVAAGAEVAASPHEAVAGAEIVVCMLADAKALNAVFDGLPERAWLGRLCVQMGTIAPAESRALAERVAADGGEYVEAPVLGSIPEARDGRLIVMVGADSDAAFERARPVLACFGSAPAHVGRIGQAAAMKLAFNQLIASLTHAFALSKALLDAEGVSLEAFMPLLRESAVYAPTFDKKLTRMVERDFANPNFPLKHLLKDVRLFEQAAASAGVDAASLAPLSAHLARLIASGHGDEDYSALSLGLVRE